MINFKTLFETVYEPRSGDEKNFKAKHIVAKYKTPYDTESQFTSNKSKAKRDADHDKGEDEQVYEAAELHTKRADKEPVIVRAVDPKTGQSKARTVLRRAGEIKIGEEVELEEAINADDYTTHGVKSQFGGFRAEIKHKTKGHTMYSGGHTYDSAAKAKGEADAYLKGYSAPGGMGNDRHAESLARKHAAAHAVKGPFAKKTVKEDLDEKVVNPYAVGMAAAMKATGDRPPLKKSTIIKGHEIAKSIKKEAMDPVGKADADIDNDGDVDKSDKYLHARRKAISKAIRKEEAGQIDELNKKTLGSYIKKSSDDLTHIQRDIGDTADMKSPEYKKLRTLRSNRKAGIGRAVERLTKEEVEMIDEAVKVGALSLHDGSSVNVTRAMADTLNAVFEQLTPANRAKMEQKLHTSKKDFNEILKFAESVNG